MAIYYYVDSTVVHAYYYTTFTIQRLFHVAVKYHSLWQSYRKEMTTSIKKRHHCKRQIHGKGQGQPDATSFQLPFGSEIAFFFFCLVYIWTPSQKFLDLLWYCHNILQSLTVIAQKWQIHIIHYSTAMKFTMKNMILQFMSSEEEVSDGHEC